MQTIHDFAKAKQRQQKITMITCYDHWSANIINESNIDCILVGDSVAMVMHGHNNTVMADSTMMVLHTQAVARGAPDKFIIGDLPFLSYRYNLDHSMQIVHQLMQAGAQAVKLEGARGNLKLIHHLVESGIPVIGHLGLTPQMIHALGGFRVQAKEAQAILQLKADADALAEAGCFALVLECIPSSVAAQITQALTIPTIGIGAGPSTDGQVLVLQDMLGMNDKFKPKFLKTYCDGFNIIKTALNQYANDVKATTFPDLAKHSYVTQEH